MEELAAGIGIFLGCLMRAILPFFKKRKEAIENGEDLKWKACYTWTIVISVATAFIATMIILPDFEIPTTNILPLSFALGWSSQDIINKLI
jgi:hypothetical protein